MKKLIASGTLGLALILSACMPSGEAEGEAADAAAVYSATGQVEAIGEGSLTIAHDPIEELSWPAMTMGFSVPNTALVAGIEPGDIVAFSFRREGNDNVITEIAPQE
jgi:Cu/Ag efflux protein CusF